MKLQLLAMAALGLSLCVGRVSAQTVQPVRSLVVVDSNGKTVGTVIGSFKRPGDPASTDAVALEVGGHVASVNVARTTFSGATQSAVFFGSLDCVGTSYIQSENLNGDDLIADSVVQPPGSTLYVADPTDTPAQRALGSFFSMDTGACVRTAHGYALRVVRALPLLDLSAAFTPPFHVVIATAAATPQCCGDCNGDGTVTIDEILTSVNEALNGCPGGQN